MALKFIFSLRLVVFIKPYINKPFLSHFNLCLVYFAFYKTMNSVLFQIKHVYKALTKSPVLRQYKMFYHLVVKTTEKNTNTCLCANKLVKTWLITE